VPRASSIGSRLSAPQPSPTPELDRSIATLVAERAVEQPEAVVLEDGELRLTYAELDARAAAVAAGLLEAGVEAEEPVGVCLPRSWQAICAFLGVVRAGAAYVPISPAYPAERQRSLLELAGARVVLSGAGHDLGLPPGPRRLDLEALACTVVDGTAPIAPGGDRLAYVLFTSGSTGTPKGVEVTHRNLVHLLRSGADIVPRPDDAVLQVVPLEFDVSGLEIWGALLNGARLVIAPRGRLDPRALGSLIAARGVTYLGLSTGVLHELIRSSLPELGGLRIACPLGDVLSPRLAGELRAAYPGVRLLNAYGPTEATIAATSYELPEQVDGPVPIGTALPGYRLHVLDEDGSPVPDGEPGELWIGGLGVARGYRNDPERTDDSFRENRFDGGTMYRSGDRVRVREDGELLFLGRVDDQVKISSQRVEPGEVELTLAGHPDLRQAAVIAREDVPGHKRLIGYAVPRPGASPAPAELRSYVGELLPSFMVPSVVVLLDSLPLNERGKVDRAALPAPGRDGADAIAVTDDPHVAPVAALMAEVLALESVGPEENFFELGGTSLLAIQLIGRLRLRLGLEAEIGAIFDAPTATGLLERLERGTEPALALPPLQPGPRHVVAPVSAAQRRAWLFGRLNPDSIAYQFAAIFRFHGKLDEAALEGAMAELLRRHEIFRTGFEERDGIPVQVIADSVALPLERIDLRGEDADAAERIARERVRTGIDPGLAPLLRWTLLHRAEDRWELVQVEHHLIHDGWSFAVVVDELSELYSARAEDRPLRLAEPEIQFQDYTRWEQRVHDSAVIAHQLEHWKRNLEPNPPLLELPADRPRPARESFDGSSVRRRLEPELAARLRAVAQSESATLFMLTLAAFYAQLQRYSGNADLQVGSGLANRRDPRSERLIGMALNTVALRCDLDGDPTVRELLGRVRATALDAYANADVPFDTVVEALKPQRDPQRSPLIQTLFSFHDALRSRDSWAGLETDLVQIVPNGSAKADLNVIGIDDGDGGITFVWEHSDLFTDAGAERLAGHHLALLAQFAADPDVRLSELDLLDEGEREQLAAWNAIEADYDREATLLQLVWRQAERNPGATAVIDGERRLGYAELVAAAAAVAGSLQERGVRRGDLVGVLLPRSADTAIAELGVLAAGAAYVPVDPQHPPARIARTLSDAGADLVLSEPELAPLLPASVAVLDVAEAVRGEAIEPVEVGPEDLAYVIYTSGSTGEPKGVEATHRNVVRLVDDPGFAELGPGTTTLHAASPAFDATTLELWGPLANGGTVATLREHPSPDAVAAAIAAHGVDTLWLTAGLFKELVDRRPDCLGGVSHLLAGGDVLSPQHVVRALAALPPTGRLSNGYGPTETTTFALTHELRPGDAVDGPVPLGRPIQGTVCDVLDVAGRPVPVGVPGELWIGGDGVARGYRNDPELTAARFEDDPARPGARRYRSGDRVRRRADGVLEFLGRLDRQVKMRGVRVEPAEIEQALRAHPALLDAAVVPFERAPGDLALAAYVVADGNGPTPDPSALREHAGARLPAAMVPAAWVELERLPLDAGGKLDRDSLPSPGREHLARIGGGEPASDAERLVVAAFEKVLGTGSVGVEDDFFALGGHSLLALALFAELERTARRRLPLSTIFEASTPRALAARVGADAPASSWDNLVALKPQGSRPPLFVVSAGDGNLVGFAPLARHLSAEQPLYGLQPSGLDGRRPLDRGIEAMAERYLEKLREVQPRGPYLLAGRCNGATVAYEMAQRLRAAGEEVPLLAALDSDPPPAGPTELAPGIPYEAMMESAWLRARSDGEETPDLDAAGGPAALAAWLRAPVAPLVSRYLYEAWHWRQDLRQAWPDPLGADGPAFAAWAWNHGIEEMRLLPALLLPAPADGCRVPGGHAWDWALATAWEELDHQPADPLSAPGWRALCARLREPVGEDGDVNRYLLAAWRRPDLRAALPAPTAGDSEALRAWAWTAGIEQGLAPELLPPSSTPLSPRRRRELQLRPLRRRARRTGSQASREARRLATEGRARALEALERRLSRPLPGARWRIERRVLAAARQARKTYRAQPWPGKVVLVTSTEFADKPPYAAWALRAAAGVELRRLPLGHVEMLREPGAEQLARCLEECAAEALRR
jgi:amino acid adenylation domain-containing protein